MEAMKFERLDHEGLWISAGGDPDTRLFLSTEKREDMPRLSTVTVSREAKAYAKTTDGGYFEIDL